MKLSIFIIFVVAMMCSCSSMKSFQEGYESLHTVQVVAELPINPGNVTICPNGRLFASIHQFRPTVERLVEVLPPDSFQSYPNKEWNSPRSKLKWNSPLGVQCDKDNSLWVLDNGAGKDPQSPRVVKIDTNTDEVRFDYEFPSDIAAPGSFVQDLAVDTERGFIYFADVGGKEGPALISLNLNTKEAYRFSDHPSLRAEDVDLVVEGRVLKAPFSGPDGEPARVGVNPITLSADNKTLFFGAMNGTKWYSVPTRLFREEASPRKIAAAIRVVGEKPISDGASTDMDGNHFFTAVNQNAIIALRSNGSLETIAKDEKLVWPDALAFGPDGWLYIAVNQLNRSAPVNGGVDAGEPPYLIAKVWTGTDGVIGR